MECPNCKNNDINIQIIDKNVVKKRYRKFNIFRSISNLIGFIFKFCFCVFAFLFFSFVGFIIVIIILTLISGANESQNRICVTERETVGTCKKCGHTFTISKQEL